MVQTPCKNLRSKNIVKTIYDIDLYQTPIRILFSSIFGFLDSCVPESTHRNKLRIIVPQLHFLRLGPPIPQRMSMGSFVPVWPNALLFIPVHMILTILTGLVRARMFVFGLFLCCWNGSLLFLSLRMLYSSAFPF